MHFKKYIFQFSLLYNLIPIRFLLKLANKNSIAIFYHFVGDKKNRLTQHLYKAKNESQFLEDITYLKKHFTSISADDFVSKNNKEKYGFFLSFDDGLANFHDVVAPILLKEKVQAINFLNSDFIDNKGLFYRYKVNILIDFIVNNTLNASQKLQFCKELTLSEFSVKPTIHQLKKINFNTAEKVDVLLQEINFNEKDYLKKHQPYLTKHQIEALIKQGFQFGAHSKNHPRYINIPVKNQVEQTLGSIDEIAKRFQLNTNYFSFPFSDDGVTTNFFNQINTKVTATFGSSGLKDENLENHYQRIPMEYNKVYSAETIIKGELLYYVLKKFFGKHKTKRV